MQPDRRILSIKTPLSYCKSITGEIRVIYAFVPSTDTGTSNIKEPKNKQYLHSVKKDVEFIVTKIFYN